MVQAVRIGVLGAAWITPVAILGPAKRLEEVEVVAVAARDPKRAQRFAAKHKIPTVHATYADLLADPGIDAVYVPLPNSLHAAWTIRALEAGKHVLCEKPITANEHEARAVADAAKDSGLIVAQAMHYAYHPVAERIRRIVQDGTLGRLRRAEVYACVPIFRSSDIRYSYELAGGATMDLGCYAVHLVRFATGREPTVVHAQALLSSPRVDRRMEAELDLGEGASARVVCSIWSKDFLKGDAVFEGELATLKAANPFAPHLFHSLTVSSGGKKKSEKLAGTFSTSHYQLKAFAASVRTGTPMPTGPEDAVKTMHVLDEIYRKAGLPIRGAP